MATVKCYYCNGQVEKHDAIKVNGLNYHPECAKLKIARTELNDYICKLFGLKRTGPVINKQISTLIDSGKYSYTGIKQALIYFYEVLKKPVKEQYKNTISIVEYVYDDAKNYYRDIERKQQEIADSVVKGISKQYSQQVNYEKKIIQKKAPKGKHFINIEDLIREGE